MPTFFWIVYFIAFGGVFFSLACEWDDEPGGWFFAALLALLWPVIALFVCAFFAWGMYSDRARIRWPWQSTDGVRANSETVDGGM